MKSVYTSALKTLRPTHVVFLGDLLSSQHIGKTEFSQRVERFKWMFPEINTGTKYIYMCGNHDIGYGCDMTADRVERFERAFGSLSGQFQVGQFHRFAYFNAQNLDGGSDLRLFNQTREFIDELARSTADAKNLILFSHIPFYKPRGVCVDGPDLEQKYDGTCHSWQHMLSEENSTRLLWTLKPAVIFSGHDHEGCWSTYTPRTGERTSGLRVGNKNYQRERDVMWSRQNHLSTYDITVRSVMAEFGGYLGLFEFDGRDRYAYHECAYYTHNPIWAMLIIDTIAALWFGAYIILFYRS